MSESEIYVDFSPEILSVLREQRVDLEAKLKEELSRRGVNATTAWAPNPTSKEEDKEVVLLILAIGATAAMVGSAAKAVIDAISRGRHAAIKERTLTPALDGHGNPIRDVHGNPVYTTTEKAGTPPPSQGSDRFKIGAKWLGIEFATGASKQE
jgi:hypothetical protein